MSPATATPKKPATRRPGGTEGADKPAASPGVSDVWNVYEVFVRPRRGLSHSHVGSVRGPDSEMALHNARDVYTRREEGVSLWVIPAVAITAWSPDERDPFFDPAADTIYRHPSFDRPTTGRTTASPASGERILYEVFVRARRGLAHSHVGSLGAPDSQTALRNARDLYVHRREGVSVWVIPSTTITASLPADKDSFFDPAADKLYRHPTYYEVPEGVQM